MTNLYFLRRLRFAAALCLVASLAFVGCDSDDPEGVSADVKVMTYNLYLGADIFGIVGVPIEEIPLVAGQLYADVEATDFPARAEAIADLIADENPALIGLQEVTLYRTQTPSDFDFEAENPIESNPPNAQDVTYDFLEILLAELDARGLDYRAVATTTNADVEIPSTADGQTFTDIRLTDRDVILAREDVEATDVVEANFSDEVTAPVPVGDEAILFLRGYNSVLATVDDVTFTFANAHLEVEVQLPPGAPGQPQEGQALELIDALSDAPSPVVLVGDFNSPADGSGTQSYGLLDVSYTDAFGSAGAPTCCQADDLSNTESELSTRIDLILHRGTVETVDTDVVGDERVDLGGPQWPSDHAGVVATLRIEN